MDLGLKGKTALVTGGSSGIGFAIAKLLHDEGASVTLVSRSQEKLEKASREIGGAKFFAVDLKSEAEIRKMVSEVLKSSSVDILVNNSGGPASGTPMEIPLASWDDGYHSLLRSVLLLTQLLTPGMRQRKWGRVLTITSTSSREIIPLLPVSSTFRAGLTALTKEISKEVGRDGVLINNILPGPTNTERLQELAVKSPDFYQGMVEASALGRIAAPEEIARVAVFLCSSANSYITGTDILADGGITRAL